MSWVRLRSRRAPVFWAPHVLASLLALTLALLGQHWSDAHVASLRSLADPDPEAALRAFDETLRALAWLAEALRPG